MVFIPQAQPHAQSLFLFPIVLVLIRLCLRNLGLYKSRIQPSACGLGLYARFVKPDISSTEAYYRKRGSASYIVREVHSVRERERERYREREKDGSDVTIVALKLAMSFALLLAKTVHLGIGEEFCAFPCQNICTSVSPLLNGAEFTLSVAKNVALFETVRILRTVKWRD